MLSADQTKVSGNVYALREMFGAFCVIIFDSKEQIKQQKEKVDFRAIYRSISAFIKSAIEKNAATNNRDTEVIYLMVALADDIFLNFEWAGKQFWEENILEQKFFNSQIAGDEIFKRINTLLTIKDEQTSDKAEFYLKMLALGFEGKYRGTEEKTIQISLCRDKLLELIEKQDSSMLMIGHRLFQKEYTYTIPTIHRKMLPEASVINYVCAFFVFMFLTISSVVWMYETKDIYNLLTEISSIALRE